MFGWSFVCLVLDVKFRSKWQLFLKSNFFLRCVCVFAAPLTYQLTNSPTYLPRTNSLLPFNAGSQQNRRSYLSRHIYNRFNILHCNMRDCPSRCVGSRVRGNGRRIVPGDSSSTSHGENLFQVGCEMLRDDLDGNGIAKRWKNMLLLLLFPPPSSSSSLCTLGR